jgi:hypothetical protein
MNGELVIVAGTIQIEVQTVEDEDEGEGVVAVKIQSGICSSASTFEIVVLPEVSTITYIRHSWPDQGVVVRPF